MFNWYFNKKIRDVCHGIKERDPTAVKEAAMHLSNLGIVTADSVLIPAPQHEGRAVYTKEIADIIAEQTGCKIADVLKSRPRRTLYEMKKQKMYDPLQFYLDGEAERNSLFFVDNVIDTGTTYKEANRLLKGKLKPLAYAVTERWHGFVTNGLILY